MKEYDVVIVGGGLVGASLAVALSRQGRRCALIETSPPPSAPEGASSQQPPWDERCIALNDTSHRIFSDYGIWSRLRFEAEPVTATHISERGRFGVARFTAKEAGIDALGYNVPMRAIGHALWKALADSAQVDILCPARVTAVTVGGERAVVDIEVEGHSGVQLGARLIAAADGATSALRKMLAIDAEVRDYEQQAIVSSVRLQRPHRGVAYERFTADGPIALIPKPGNAASLVWTLPVERASEAMTWGDADYLSQAQQAFGGRLGSFQALGRRWAHPLSRVMAERLTSVRTVFVGNAAQSLHPVAAQGFNLGLRDVAVLARTALESGAVDIGSDALLAEYERRRREDRQSVAGLTDLMVRVFSNRLPGLRQTRHWGLVGMELFPPARDRILRQHLGYIGVPTTVKTNGG